ncbi:MAG: sigma-70 family RNA polymerase sigma factor [Spirochaetes bacterium]|jgi:RNA polymerase sigma-70 factor (ECF subfamily)|nr:sigma-70 family RNA polymerase sigma factor [Spirochaetota bacterium]
MMKSLIERIRVALDGGDPDKRESLMEYIWSEYGHRVSYYISTIVSRDTAHFDDIFQDAMIRIFENIGSYDPAYSFNTWIYSIARNLCFDYLKRPQNAAEGMLMDDFPDPGSGPQEAALRDEVMHRIDASIRGLSAGDREIAYLRFFENLRYREISALTGVKLNTVKAKLRLIKDRLRAGLGDIYY